MSAKVAEAKECIQRAINDESKPWTPLLALAESKSGVPRLYIFCGKFSFASLSPAFRGILGKKRTKDSSFGVIPPSLASVESLRGR